MADFDGMHRVAILAVLATAAAIAGACHFTSGTATVIRIDGSTEETFRSSLDAVKGSLPVDRRDEFEAAMSAHACVASLPPGERNNPFADVMAGAADKDAPSRRLRARLDGLTGQQVISTSPDTPGIPFGGRLAFPRRDVNESAAIAALKNISSAQAQIQASGINDQNRNGNGEYCWFGEMAGRSDIAMPDGKMLRVQPPALSPSFGNPKDDRITRAGYLFQMFLPDKDAQPMPNGRPDAGRAEVLWCCYAWPTDARTSGERAFFVNQAGEVLAMRNGNAKYTGTSSPPHPLAAFKAAEKSMGGALAANTVGNDGETWEVVY